MNNIYFNTIAEAAEELVMSKKQVRKLLDAGAFTDNKLTGKNRRVIFNQFGPVQPKVLSAAFTFTSFNKKASRV